MLKGRNNTFSVGTGIKKKDKWHDKIRGGGNLGWSVDDFIDDIRKMTKESAV